MTATAHSAERCEVPLSANAEAMLRMIERAAEHGEPCPTNNQFTERLYLGSISAPPAMLDRLVKRGLITVERGPVARVVTIVATGKRTAGEIKVRHFSAGKGKGPQKREYRPRPTDWAPPPDKACNAKHVSRDPCPRCGIRADHGCAHSNARLAVEMSL